MSIRLNLIVDDDVPEMLSALAKGERKRGEWVSDIVRARYASQQRGQIGASDVERLTYEVAGLEGEVARLAARVEELERQAHK